MEWSFFVLERDCNDANHSLVFKSMQIKDHTDLENDANKIMCMLQEGGVFWF